MAKQIKILEMKKIAPDWCTIYDFNTYHVPCGAGGQVVIVMLWLATNHTEFKL